MLQQTPAITLIATFIMEIMCGDSYLERLYCDVHHQRQYQKLCSFIEFMWVVKDRSPVKTGILHRAVPILFILCLWLQKILLYKAVSL